VFSRPTTLSLVAIAGVAGLLLTSVTTGAAQQIPMPTNQQTGISVVSEGIVLATPNVVRITLGVEIFDASLSNGQTEAARRMDAVVQRLKAAGIDESNIRTVNYTINPQYDTRDGNTQVLRGYQIQNLVEIKSNNVPGLGALLDEVVAAGASRIYGIRFESADTPRLKEQARDQAMQNARAKAEQLARNAGVSVGRPILIEESDTGDAVPVRAEAAAQAGLRAAPSTPIQPGELQVRTIVRVVWSIQ
jgi:uncharacterized protein